MPEMLDFEEEKLPEGWIKLKLSDGTVLKVKPEITAVVRLDKYDQFGNPVYAVSTASILRLVHVPDKLRKSFKKQGKPYG
jgi:hypothetical protein